MSDSGENSLKLGSNTSRKTWNQIRTIVEFGKKYLYYLNGDSTANICFREYFNQESSQYETRIYFLGSSQNREINIKYINIQANQQYDKLTGLPIFSNYQFFANDRPLTKEEQLLKERMRCSFNGITSFVLDPTSGRLVFSERSELFYFDDEIPNTKNEYPIEVATFSKGAIDVQICPSNSNLISYILNDNLWIQDLITKQEIQLTHTEEPKKSGVPSYAVQEEFDRYTGYWWQPNSQTNSDGSITYRIVYEEIDDECVDLTYITPSCENENGYDTYRYPKAGTTNSRIYLKMIEVTFFPEDQNKAPLITRKRMSSSFYNLFSWFEYLARADWTPNGKYFWAQVYNRLQTTKVTVLMPVDYFVNDIDPNSEMQTSSVFEETKQIFILNEEIFDAWINYHDKMFFLEENEPNSLNFITASEESGYLHLYLHKVSLNLSDSISVSEGLLRAKTVSKIKLTEGDWSIEFEGNLNVDQKNHLVYFTAYKDPVENQLFVVDYTQPKKVKQLTQNGSSHSITMNSKCNYFVTTFSNLSNPNKTCLFEIQNADLGIDKVEAKQIAQIICREEIKPQPIVDPITHQFKPSIALINSLLNLNLDLTFMLNSNTDELSLVQHLFKPPQIFSFQTDDNCKLYGMIYMPYNYEHGVQYPTVLYVYAGPKIQIVTNSYKPSKYTRFNILALLGYCVVAVDSRGSNNRGREFETHIYKKMGTVEVSDQVKGLESAARIFNCIDMKRVGIYGWSYGGYMSLMGLAQRPDFFKVAISGAPVTTWNLYDTAYTERYMGLPDEETEAYYRGSVLSYAKNFPDEENRLLIIHGMIDENVHFAHTRKLIDTLIKENKPYQLLVYPHERHGIRSSEGSIHCDTNFYSFLEQHLK